MGWLLLLVLIAVPLGLLYRRVERLERQVGALVAIQRDRAEAAAPAAPAAPADPSAEPTPRPAQRLQAPESALSSDPVAADFVFDTPDERPSELQPPPDRAADIDEPRETSRRSGLDFEDLFGRKLPIWAGGIALAIAGVFLVRYSIEAGLVTPAVRVSFSFVFGIVLLAAAEWAYRAEGAVRDPRVRQALAGAGIATLFAAFYLAGTQYQLIGAGAAFIGLAAVTAGATGMSFRFGLPCAVLGLVGGFAAPAMVQGEQANVPLLATYLALVTGGLAFAGQAQGRRWLGYAAVAAGLGWGFLLLFAGAASSTEVAAIAIYAIVLGTVLPAFLSIGGSAQARLPHVAAATVATLQVAILVDDGGFSSLVWGLYLLLGGALTFLGWTRPALRLGSGVAATVAIWLLIFWSFPPAQQIAWVSAALAALFALIPLALVWRERAGRGDILQLALFPAGLAAALYWHFAETAGEERMMLAGAMAALAAIPAIATALLWGRDPRQLATPLASAAALVFAALLLASSPWAASLCALAAAAVPLWLAARHNSDAARRVAWAGAAVTLVALTLTPEFASEAGRLIGDRQGETQVLRALLRWLSACAVFAALSLAGRAAEVRLAQAVGAVLVYGAAAQILPSDGLAWLSALGAVTVLRWLPRRQALAVTWLAIATLWALPPLAEWIQAGSAALGGRPVFVDRLPELRTALLFMAPAAPALAFWIASQRKALTRPQRLAVGAFAAVLALAILHTVFKQAFAIGTLDRFVLLGMAERTVWQGLLAAAGAALLWRAPARWRMPGWLLLAASVSHFAVFTLGWHNPLWARQAVGPVPLANLLLPAYAIPFAALAFARARLAGAFTRLAPLIEAMQMLLLAFFMLSSLRHAFAGSVLTDPPLGQAEDLLRSLAAILLAVGFLLWGARRERRGWRIGSLVLVLLAVFKVFLLDTAGLDGLLRIASFMALGFSLIGIGWFYSRQLSAQKPAPEPS